MPTDPRITITVDATTARALLAALTEAVAALDGERPAPTVINATDLPFELPAEMHIEHVLDMPDGTTQHHRETIRFPQRLTCTTCGTDLRRVDVVSLVATRPYVQQAPGPWICPEGHAGPHL